MFEDFPGQVCWIRAVLTPGELARVRYIEYSYWNELSGGSRLPGAAAERIRTGVRAFGVLNGRFIAAARAVRRGSASHHSFWPGHDGRRSCAPVTSSR